MNNAIVLIECEDQTGIVSAVTEFVYSNKGNIIELDQYTDHENNHFFMRVEWSLDQFLLSSEKIYQRFKELLAQRFKMNFEVYFSNHRPRMALFVTKLSHCLFDILGRWQSGDLNIDIPVVVSNHQELQPIVEKFNIPFYYIPIDKSNKSEQEKNQIEILKEYNIEFVVLARYMQILSENFIQSFEHKIINIHHSFLPAFAGAKPYHAAYERGVKIIGATAHYVTEDLDAGPIIEQNVSRVSHRNSINDLVKIGQDIEKIVLSKAISLHINRKTLVVNNKTIIFN